MSESCRMRVRVDMAQLRRRSRWFRQRRADGVDFLVKLEGCGRESNRDRVLGALQATRAGVPRDGGPRYMPLVYATELGTLVRLVDDPPWEQVVEELVHQLEADHHRGTISAGKASFELVTTLLDAPPVPILTVAWTMDPPVTRGPFYDSGQPQYRWGVP